MPTRWTTGGSDTDLGAYVNIGSVSGLLETKGVRIPRQRGYRYMADEEPWTDREVVRLWKEVGKEYRSTDLPLPWEHTRIAGYHSDPRQLRRDLRKVRERAEHQCRLWNTMCGRHVLYAHTRLPVDRWASYTDDTGGYRDPRREPWYLGSALDTFDPTYSDVYIDLGVLGVTPEEAGALFDGPDDETL